MNPQLLIIFFIPCPSTLFREFEVDDGEIDSMDEDDYIENEDEMVSFDPNKFLKIMRKTLGEYVGLV